MSEHLQFQLEMYCQGSIYMTVQWVLGEMKASPENLAHALAQSVPEELAKSISGAGDVVKFVFVGVIRMESRKLLCGRADAGKQDIPSRCRPALPQPVDRL